MRRRIIVSLSAAAAVLSATAAAAALTWHTGGEAIDFVTARGTLVRLQGEGLYDLDSLFAAAGFRAQDTVTLLVAAPALACLAWRFHRGSAPAVPLLLGVLAYVLYVSASMALGAAYNPMFLVHIWSFSASFFAFVLVFHAPLAFPGWPARREAASVMFAAGALTLFVWMAPLVEALVRGRSPVLLDHYTTLVTFALDLAIITPATFLAGVLILRRSATGYRIGCALMGLVILLAPVIALGTINQLKAGIRFSQGEIAGPIAGFLLLAAAGARTLWLILRQIEVPNDVTHGLYLVRAADRRRPQRRFS